jgi:hypothetical protein
VWDEWTLRPEIEVGALEPLDVGPFPHDPRTHRDRPAVGRRGGVRRPGLVQRAVEAVAAEPRHHRVACRRFGLHEPILPKGGET